MLPYVKLLTILWFIMQMWANCDFFGTNNKYHKMFPSFCPKTVFSCHLSTCKLWTNFSLCFFLSPCAELYFCHFGFNYWTVKVVILEELLWMSCEQSTLEILTFADHPQFSKKSLGLKNCLVSYHSSRRGFSSCSQHLSQLGIKSYEYIYMENYNKNKISVPF